jgi:hypothetical protein
MYEGKVTVADGKRGNPYFGYMGSHPTKKGRKGYGYDSDLHTDVYFTKFFNGIEYESKDTSKTKKYILECQKEWKSKGYNTRVVKHVTGKGWVLYAKKRS